jgi:hypothetical protein
MRMMRSLCAAGLLCGLALGAMTVSGGCGGAPPTGTQVVEDAKAKEEAQNRAEKMKEFMAQKTQQSRKGQSRQ